MGGEKITIPKSKGKAWEWPVKIGIGQGDNFLDFDPNDQYPSIAEVSNIRAWNAQFKESFHHNILLFESFKEALEAFEKEQRVTADIIIVQVPEDFSKKHPDWSTLDALSLKWARQTKAGGVYYIKNEIASEGLLSTIVFQLLSKQGVNESIESLDNVIVRSYESDNVKDRSKLSSRGLKLGRLGFQNIAGIEVEPESSGGIREDQQEMFGDIDGIELPSYQATSDDAETQVEIKPTTQRPKRSKPGTGKKKKAPPRYLRASVYNRDDQLLVEKFLLPLNPYQLLIGIGNQEEGWTSAEEALEVEEIFKDPQLKYIDIDLTIQLNTTPLPVYKRLVLPKLGKSNVISLDFSTDAVQDLFEADIYAYYGSRLLQQVKYRIAVKRPGATPALPGPELKPVVMLRQNLSELSEQPNYSTSLSLSDQAGQKNASEVTGRHGGETRPVSFYDRCPGNGKESQRAARNRRFVRGPDQS